MRAVVATGAGRYGDPWHPFARTSQEIARILAGDGWRVEAREPDEALAALDGADLLVVNAGDPWRNGETGRGAPEASRAGLADALARGIGVLAVHNAVSSLRDYPEWIPAIGGEWIVDRSGHPPIGPAVFDVVRPEHEIVAGLDRIEAFDERYARLAVADEAEVLAVSEVDGERQPALWALERAGGRSVVSTLGHDERSFSSPAHREVLRRAARWTVSA
ncbi:ThuA domain-containing protein [Microbacterium sp. gxy059]|uniref:ThuA domain-containing protein n=1 Tax=Microbacterium sp. gxy059 TaxID=2957199 RepID=UPI003D985924